MSDRTHWPNCWRDPAHHDCAVAKIEDLTSEHEKWRQLLFDRSAQIGWYKGAVTDLNGRIAAARALCDEQARDEGLWFVAERVTEAHLQAALRRLHAAIEWDA